MEEDEARFAVREEFDSVKEENGVSCQIKNW